MHQRKDSVFSEPLALGTRTQITATRQHLGCSTYLAISMRAIKREKSAEMQEGNRQEKKGNIQTQEGENIKKKNH